jgi:hypothetical protein
MNPAKKAARIATAVYLAVLLVAGQLFGSTLQEQTKPRRSAHLKKS